mgnify:CR=1 FL=1
MSDGAIIASHFEDAEQQREAGLMGMWLFLATELLLFAGLFGGFAIYRGLHGDAFAAAARHLDLPLATANTVILLTSGLSMALAERMAAVPKNQLMMQKLLVNQAYENMGLQTTQMFATLFDGITRHSPEGVWFKQRAEEVGFQQAVKERDGGTPIAEGVSRSTYKF